MKKTLIAVVLTLVVCLCAFGATFAWLMDSTETVTNTFTVGDVEITLTETTGTTYHMVPGATLSKDPTVTVEEKSEACWLFIKIVETNNLFDTDKKFVTYSMDGNWSALDGETGVYYIQVDAATASAGKSYAVLLNNQVVINTAATAAHLETAESAQPSLAFTAYAVQQEGVTTATAAWAVATTGNLPTT